MISGMFRVKMEIYDYISARITELRAGKAESIISSELGRGVTYLNQIITQKQRAPLDSISEICDYFGISLAEFFQTDADRKVLPEKVERIREEMKSMDPDDLENVIKLIAKLPKRKRPR